MYLPPLELVSHSNGISFNGVNLHLGPYGCIGRQLALLEMRNLMVQILNNFNVFKFAPDEDGTNLLVHGKDHFTIGLLPFNLIFDKQ